MQLESLPTRKRSLCQTTLTPVDEQIRKNKKPLSLSVFETYASNDETHTLVESKVWTRWRLDVKYLLVISGESARMDGRLIVCVSNAWYLSCWTKQSKKSSCVFFFFFWRKSGPRRMRIVQPCFFLRSFPSPRESREWVARNESLQRAALRNIFIPGGSQRERNRITYYVSRDYGLHSRAINERGPPDR